MFKEWAEAIVLQFQNNTTIAIVTAVAVPLFSLAAAYRVNGYWISICLAIVWLASAILLFHLLSKLVPAMLPRLLLTGAMWCVVGLVLYYTLWFKPAPLSVGVMASQAAYADGTTVDNIEWLCKFTRIDLVLDNQSEVAYSDFDFSIKMDQPVVDAAIKGGSHSVTLKPDNLPLTLNIEMLTVGGPRSALGLQLVASDRGYRLQVERLAAKDSVKLVFAIGSMTGKPTLVEVDKVLRIGYGDGTYLWYGYPQHSAAIYGDKVVPSKLSISGKYLADGLNRKVERDIQVRDVLSTLTINQPAPKAEPQE